jgi:hypothetical protein
VTAKVHINGEIFEFDADHRPLAEALELEKQYGAPYGQWEQDLGDGHAKAIAGLVWLVWHRNGRDVPFADILSGKVEVDLATIERENDGDAGEPGPTSPAAVAGSGPDPSPGA